MRTPICKGRRSCQRRADARLQELQAELFHAGRLSAMGQMAGALAHELGQPLGAIANYINTARRFLTEGREHAPDLARMNMDHAAEVVLRAGRIIQRLREFVADGQPERHPENIADLIEDAGLLALIGAAALDIDVARHIAPKLPLALVDRTQIQQVLVNLIRNAIEAMADSERRELDFDGCAVRWRDNRNRSGRQRTGDTRRCRFPPVPAVCHDEAAEHGAGSFDLPFDCRGAWRATLARARRKRWNGLPVHSADS